MEMPMRALYFALALVALSATLADAKPASLADAKPAATAPDPLLRAYVTTSVGSFTTAAQHDADPRYDVAEAVIAAIWPGSTDGVWLYQEQAIINRMGADGKPTAAEIARSKPYFQRIGHITRLPDGSLRRENHVILTPARFVGLGRPGYSGPLPTPADLGEAGCHNIITPVAAGHFTATTQNCRNSYRGAVTMLSLAVTTPDTYANWDRGFDANGARVWGPADGGYIFRKLP